jgi:hypothetical protein
MYLKYVGGGDPCGLPPPKKGVSTQVDGGEPGRRYLLYLCSAIYTQHTAIRSPLAKAEPGLESEI